MSELEKILALTPSTYKLYAYLRLVGDGNSVVRGKTRQDLMNATNMGSVTIYRSLKELEELKILEYDGRRSYYRIL